MYILVLNAGSSSQKSRLYAIDETLPEDAPIPLWQADTEWMAEKGAAHLKIRTARGQELQREIAADSRAHVLEETLKTLWSGPTQVIEQASEIAIAGHRVVHGGPHYQQSVLITEEVKETIRQLRPFAPLHNPINLEGIETLEQVLPNIPQVAVFDTAFHSQIPLKTVVYPGPYSWYEHGIRRYGFHGISHQYCAHKSAQIVGRNLDALRIVNCHLGNGCSLAAIRDGISIDTTMGFTPLEGLMMGTRSGTVDPSILIYLRREHEQSADELERLLNKESGLLGISGLTQDMRAILQACDEGNERAQLALDMYIYRLQTFIGAMIASLNGIDVLTFTGGVGENAARVRAGACAAFAFLKLELDEEKNTTSLSDQEISTQASAVRVLIVHTEEDWQIAKECWQIIQHS